MDKARYRGEYVQEIRGGRVAFPWRINTDETYEWLVAEYSLSGEPESIVMIMSSALVKQHIAELAQESDSAPHVIRGEFLPDADGVWVLPKELQQRFDSDALVFIGLDETVELVSREELEKMNRDMEGMHADMLCKFDL